ncbi:hypothetical protein HYALB_00009509 [Hymenoscyphus albidus]|uniref:Rhodopsin domain-containing protein n=1 Tax=Hymenoscyphus albidus TaxID=595503 RepID=A0A9N9LPB8_9HELO|nr:hypothetical protein HYALB_00009509 [Hymenoscyphus albidus]
MPDPFLTELWVEYGVGVAFFALRFFARWNTVGFRKFAFDDMFCVIGLVSTSPTKGSTVGLTPESALFLPVKTQHDFEIGAKGLFTAWICYISLTWCLKAVLLVLYTRLTLGLWQHKIAKAVSIFCVFAWATCIIAHFAVCVPIKRAWQVIPYPGDECVLRKPNHLLVGILNILSDIGVLAITLPILWNAQIPIRRKLVLMVLFSSGIFVIVTVVLRVIFSIGSIDHLPVASQWALRETFVTVLTVTAPGIKPLFNSYKWINKSSEKSTGSHGGYKVGRSQSRFKSNTTRTGNTTTVHADEAALGNNRQYYELSTAANKMGASKLTRSSASQEYIVKKSSDNNIHVVTEYTTFHDNSDEERSVNFGKRPQETGVADRKLSKA